MEQPFPVLVADTRAEQRKLLKRELSIRGFEVFDAAEATKILTLIKENKVRLLLLNIHFPDIYDSIKLIEIIKIYNYLFPIIVLINDFSESALSDLFSIGVFNYVKKPFEIGSIVRQIRKIFYKEAIFNSKRQYDREDMKIKVEIYEKGGSQIYDCTTFNISPGGAFLKLDLRRKKGSKLKITLISETQRYDILGEVIWEREIFFNGLPPGMGIKFIDIDSAARNFIEQSIMGHKISSFAD